MPSQLRLASSFEEVTSALGLDHTNIEDVRIYHIILVPNPLTVPMECHVTDINHQHEVEQGRQRLVQNRYALLPQYKRSATMQPLHHRTQIDFSAFLQETKAIQLTASPKSRARYDLVGKASGPDSSSAAISWLLWQALRRGEQGV